MRATLPVASLTPDDIGQFVKPLHGVDRHVDDATRRNIVDDDRNADGVVDRLEMLIKALLRRLVVIGRDDQNGVRAGLLGETRKLDRLLRVVRPRAGDDRNPAPWPRRCRWRRRVRCSSCDSVGLSPVVPTGTRPCEPLTICQSTRARKRGLVEAPVLKWRDKRGDRTPESRLSLPLPLPPFRPSDAAIYGLCSTNKRYGANKYPAWTQHET